MEQKNSKIIDLNVTTPTITLNVNGLNPPVKDQLYAQLHAT